MIDRRNRRLFWQKIKDIWKKLKVSGKKLYDFEQKKLNAMQLGDSV